jgi:hypothetical protein
VTISLPNSIPDPTKLKLIQSLCCHLQQRSNQPVGFYLDGDQKLRLYLENSSQAHQYVTKEVTLEQTLPQLPRNLANGDLYVLAITLVASLFQLVESPWLDKSWNKKGIFFVTPKNTGKPDMVDIKYPILMEYFSEKTVQVSPRTRERSILLALGIMLLEIASGRPIEDMREPEDLGSSTTPNDETNHKTATRWLFEMVDNGELTNGFSSAITTCLQAYINPNANFTNIDFQQMIEHMVLRPLVDEMDCVVNGPQW